MIGSSATKCDPACENDAYVQKNTFTLIHINFNLLQLSNLLYKLYTYLRIYKFLIVLDSQLLAVLLIKFSLMYHA